MVLEDQTRWKLCGRKWTGTTERLIEDLESAYDNEPNMFSIRIHHGENFQMYLGRMYLNGHVDISDIVDIDLFIVVALNMMAVQLGYTGESEPLFYNYLRPLTSLDEGLYAWACEENVRCLSTLVRSFKLIEVYIEHDMRTGRMHTRQDTQNLRLTTSGSSLGNCHCTTLLGAKCCLSGRRGSWQRSGPSLTCVSTWNSIAGHKCMRESSSICKRSTMARRLLSRKGIRFRTKTELMTWSASDADVPRVFPR
nr:hypothetical protein [Tanacetum cinerariifolium]